MVINTRSTWFWGHRLRKPSDNQNHRARQGFTAIELVGVLAVIAILSVVLVPSVVKRIDRAAWTKENSDLGTMAESLTQYAVGQRQIPVATNFPPAIASYLNLSASQIRTTPRYFARAFVTDPNLNIAGGGLPYTQTTLGSSNRPTNVRAMIVSTIARALPTISSSDFDNIWNAPEGTVPSALASSWAGGKGEDLRIQRLDFGSLFHKLLLLNIDPSNDGRYSIDNYSVTNVARGRNQRTGHFFDGTVINFYYGNGTLQSREILHSDESFVYENNRWGRGLSSGDDDIGEFGEWVSEFLLPPAPSDPKFRATQQAVINEFYSYLWGYAVWAIGDQSAVPVIPPFEGVGQNGVTQFPSYTVVYTAQGLMAVFTDNLIH